MAHAWEGAHNLQTQFINHDEVIYCNNGFPEGTVAGSLSVFECFLNLGWIGTPLVPLLREGGPAMRQWFANLFQRMREEDPPNEAPLIAELVELLDLPPVEQALTTVPFRTAVVTRLERPE